MYFISKKSIFGKYFQREKHCVQLCQTPDLPPWRLVISWVCQMWPGLWHGSQLCTVSRKQPDYDYHHSFSSSFWLSVTTSTLKLCSVSSGVSRPHGCCHVMLTFPPAHTFELLEISCVDPVLWSDTPFLSLLPLIVSFSNNIVKLTGIHPQPSSGYSSFPY